MFKTSLQRQQHAELELWALIRDGKLLSPDGSIDRHSLVEAVRSVLSTAKLTQDGYRQPVGNHVSFPDEPAHAETYRNVTMQMADAIRAKALPRNIYVGFADAFAKADIGLTREPWNLKPTTVGAA